VGNKISDIKGCFTNLPFDAINVVFGACWSLLLLFPINDCVWENLNSLTDSENMHIRYLHISYSSCFAGKFILLIPQFHDLLYLILHQYCSSTTTFKNFTVSIIKLYIFVKSSINTMNSKRLCCYEDSLLK